MKVRGLLGSASIAVLLAQGAALAQDVPISVTAISGDQLRNAGVVDLAEQLFISPNISLMNGSNFATELGGGIRLRGLVDPFDVDLEGSIAQFNGSVGEAWATGRASIPIDAISNINITGSGSLGLIGGTPSYRFGVGGQLPVTTGTEFFLEGIARGHVGYGPSDFGVRGGLRIFPGQFTNLDVLKGPQGTLFGGSSSPVVWVGGSTSFVPSASRFIPAVDGGVKLKTGTQLDFGLKASFGYEVPAGDYSVWAGVETGFQLSKEVRGYLGYEVGSIGGFTANRLGVGIEYKWDPNWSVTGELSGRGAPGTFSEAAFKAGLRYTIEPESDWDDPITIDVGPSTFRPYVGKSMQLISKGGLVVVPALDFGVDFPQAGGLVPGVRGQIGYQYPLGEVEVGGGARLGYQATPEIMPYGFIDIFTVGGSPLHQRIGLGAEYAIDDKWALTGEVFARGALGTVQEFGGKFGVTYDLSDVFNRGYDR